MKINFSKRIMQWFLFTVIWTLSISAIKKQSESIDYVPDKNTAIKVAECIFSAFLKQETIDSSKPFTAIRVDGIWEVDGLPPPKGSKGGTIHIRLQASDCKVVKMWFDK